jgi:hypothetical protein
VETREWFWILAILIGAAGHAYSQPSLGLDPNFRPAITRPDGQIHAVAIQADGKIVIGGSFTEVNGHARTNLARLNRDGTLDMNYPRHSLGRWSIVQGMTLQADGKLLCWKSDEDTGGDTVSLLRL